MLGTQTSVPPRKPLKSILPITQLVRLAKQSFVAHSSAIPKFCYLPIGLFFDFEEAARAEWLSLQPMPAGWADGMQIVSYDGMEIRVAHGYSIVLSEVAL